jgi:arsenite-transporting ATPase
VLDCELGSDPGAITVNLDGVQLDGRRELQQSWGAIADYFRRALGWAELDRLRADELMVVPGLDQLVALSRLRSLASDGPWEALVVDCAPSADSLRLLSLPEVLQWYVDRLFGSNGAMGAWMRRRVARSVALPAPDDAVINSVTDLSQELSRLRALLDHSTTTARVVLTPERVVVAEAQRTMAYLALYGYTVDAALVNRVPNDSFDTPALAPWIAAQRRQLAAIESAFAPLPILEASHRFFEPVGVEALRTVANELYGSLDPLGILCTQQAIEVSTSGDESSVRLFAPGVRRDDIELERAGGELVVTLGEYRRFVHLPETLRDQPVVRAGRDGAYLEVVFGGIAGA